VCAYVCACMCSKNRVERSVSVQRRVTGGLVRQESCRTQHICSEETKGARVCVCVYACVCDVCACMCSKNRVERSISVQRRRRVTGGRVRQQEGLYVWNAAAYTRRGGHQKQLCVWPRSCKTQRICSEEETRGARVCVRVRVRASAPLLLRACAAG